MSDKFPTKVSELPQEAFFAILTEQSVTIPGDERSRTNPGHGYPEHTVSYWSMERFPDQKSWTTEVERLTKKKNWQPNFMPVKIIPASVQTNVEITIQEYYDTISDLWNANPTIEFKS